MVIRSHDPTTSARVASLAASMGSRELARRTGVRRETIDAARRGAPLTPRMWGELREAVQRVFPAPAPARPTVRIVQRADRKTDEAPPTRGPCVGCGVKRVPRGRLCYRCEHRSGEKRTARCPSCGSTFRGTNYIAAGFCCVLRPEDKPGECAWCGDDLVLRPGETEEELAERIYCRKACSISYHAELSRGTLAEAMIRPAEEC